MFLRLAIVAAILALALPSAGQDANFPPTTVELLLGAGLDFAKEQVAKHPNEAKQTSIMDEPTQLYLDEERVANLAANKLRVWTVKTGDKIKLPDGTVLDVGIVAGVAQEQTKLGQIIRVRWKAVLVHDAANGWRGFQFKLPDRVFEGDPDLVRKVWDAWIDPKLAKALQWAHDKVGPHLPALVLVQNPQIVDAVQVETAVGDKKVTLNVKARAKISPPGAPVLELVVVTGDWPEIKQHLFCKSRSSEVGHLASMVR